MSFVLGISLLLASSCVTWVIENLDKYKYLELTDGKDVPCHLQQDSQAKDYCSKYILLWQVLNQICYNLGMWLFVMRYWALSKVL